MAPKPRLGVPQPLPTHTQGSPVYRYCRRAPKATGLICRQRPQGDKVRGSHSTRIPCSPSALPIPGRDAPEGA